MIIIDPFMEHCFQCPPPPPPHSYHFLLIVYRDDVCCCLVAPNDGCYRKKVDEVDDLTWLFEMLFFDWRTIPSTATTHLQQ
mmetsp:Transcript_22532/g.25397  ORF Transcript_22532/g.25397 Transcript_22532/m.25397 type:complete len:81 (+) Transcript_22532:83-325(+)